MFEVPDGQAGYASVDSLGSGVIDLAWNEGSRGLGVLPEHRGKGLGRAILLRAIEKLREAGVRDVLLQVESENANALGLYESCGFARTSTMDYFKMDF